MSEACKGVMDELLLLLLLLMLMLLLLLHVASWHHLREQFLRLVPATPPSVKRSERHQQPVTRHTSHVTRHTSHVTSHLCNSLRGP